MSKLHYDRVRRARGLPVPLPSTPKARPLGPPVLWVWRGTAIRFRSDVEQAGTWDEFFGELAESDGYNTGHARWGKRGHDAIMALTPNRERPSVSADFERRVFSVRERQAEKNIREAFGLSFRDLFRRSA